MEAATTQISRQFVGIYCWRQVHTEECHSTVNLGIFIEVLELYLLTELVRTVSIEGAQFSRQLDTDFKEDFRAGFVR